MKEKDSPQYLQITFNDDDSVTVVASIETAILADNDVVVGFKKGGTQVNRVVSATKDAMVFDHITAIAENMLVFNAADVISRAADEEARVGLARRVVAEHEAKRAKEPQAKEPESG